MFGSSIWPIIGAKVQLFARTRGQYLIKSVEKLTVLELWVMGYGVRETDSLR